MKTFKQFLDESYCHITALEKGLKKLDNHSYESINNLMTDISKKNNITGKDLHNDFVSRHGKTPDDWIKKELEEAYGWGKMSQDKIDKIAKAKKREEKEKGLLRRPNTSSSKNSINYFSKISRTDKLSEDLRKWFKQKWVRMDTKGNIKGDCARDPGEGKPKCLPQAKAHALGKEGRASAARRKRREDPNPERRGAPINVRTESAAAAIAAATAIAKKKSGNYDSDGFRKTPYKNSDHPLRKSNLQRKKEQK
jgi:hypothetical protein